MRKCFSLGICILLFLCACGKSDPYKGKTVINLQGGDWGYPSPYGHYTRGPGVFKMKLIFDSLLEKGSKGMIPWIAERWSVSQDGKSYTFFIKKGIKWHDGETLTADDVKFSFEYFAENPPVSDELSSPGKRIISRIDVVDSLTVKVTASEREAALFERLGSVRIIPRHIWEKVKDPRTFKSPLSVVGSGPYILKDYSREEGAYLFEAFKGYIIAQPSVDVIRFIPVSDPVLAFEKGEIDITSIAPDLLPRYEKKSEYTIVKNPSFWGYRLLFNMKRRGELKDKNVRHAFAYSIDRDELVMKVARGGAVAGSAGYLPVDHIWYNGTVSGYPFNPSKAQKLLNGKRYHFRLLTANSREELRIAELLRMTLSQAGIDIDVKSVDMKSRDAAVRRGDYELALNGHGGWGADADILRKNYAHNALPGYSNETIDRLAESQLHEMNRDRRRAIVFSLQEAIAEELPQIPLYNTKGFTVYRSERYRKWVHIFDHHEVTHNKVSYVEKGQDL